MDNEEKTGEKRERADEATRFKAGNPGGPGHPKGVPNYKTRFKILLEKYATLKAPKTVVKSLKEELDDIPDGITIEEAEAFRVHLAALSGEPWALDRLHDKPGQAVDLTTNGESVNTQNKLEFVIYNGDKKKEDEKPEQPPV